MRNFIRCTSCLLVVLLVASRDVRAQETDADTTRRFSVFLGPTLATMPAHLDFSFANNVGLGVSRDFAGRNAMFRPRISLAYDQWRSTTRQSIRMGTAVAEGVFMPGELVRGVRPYAFGGVGLFTRLPISGSSVVAGSLTRFDDGAKYYAGWSTGAGVEVGRAFAQYRFMTSVQAGPRWAGLNLGYRL